MDKLPRADLISSNAGWHFPGFLTSWMICLMFAALSVNAPVYGQTAGQAAGQAAGQTTGPNEGKTVEAPALPLQQQKQAITPAASSESKLQASSILRRRLPETNAIDESNSPDSIESLISDPAASTKGASRAFLIAAETVLYLIVLLLAVYMLRHYIFTLNRLFARQRHP